MLETADRLRSDALACFQAGVDAADPFAAVSRHLHFANATLKIADNCGTWQRIHLIAFGKAACPMLEAGLSIIPTERLASLPLAVTSDENFRVIQGAEVLAASHPLPDQRGILAAKKIIDRLSQTQAGDLVLLLISGGGSALLPAPSQGISLADKILTTELLLASGANINAINCVRKHCSQIKGGGLARLAAKADLEALVLSDVLGDDLSSIASGPAVADPSSFADAIAILQNYQIWEQIPSSVRQHLAAGEAGLNPETLKPEDPLLQNKHHTVIGSNAMSVDAAVAEAGLLGYQTLQVPQPVSGEAQKAAYQLAAQANQYLRQNPDQAIALIAGGETTVSLGGEYGLGGRNQELALAFLLAAKQYDWSGNWCCLSAGSDGRDGPTDAAGGLVDQNTYQAMLAANYQPDQYLLAHNSYPLLQAVNALVISGATGTNVADLQIILLVPNNQKLP